MDFSKNKYIQHSIAVFILIVAAFIYFFPTSQGKKILSHDQISSISAGKEVRDYESKGETVLWASRLFSGMPAFVVAYKAKSNLLHNIVKTRDLMPKSMWIWLMLLLGFYVCLSILGYDIGISLIGALAFGLSTWFMLSIEAGHASKILTIAFIPPLIASVIITYRGKWLTGGILTSLFLGFAIMFAHIQILYYSIFFIGIIFLFKLIESVKEKNVVPVIKRTIILIGFASLAVLSNITSLWTTYDYGKESIRGGKSELTKEKEQSTGLDLDYVMQYSYGKSESLNILIPGFAGSGLKLDEGSDMFDDLRKKGVSKKQALDYLSGIPVFYGDPPINTGPSYFGAAIIFLFVLMMFIYKKRFKWVLFSVIIMALFFAWGRHFLTLNEFMFDHFPLYNKFRTPSMWLSMAMIAVVIGAMIGLKSIFNKEYDTTKIKKSLYYTGGILGGFVLVIYLFKSSFTDFSGPYDAQLEQNGIDIATLMTDRISMLNADIFRTLFIIILMFGGIWAIINNKLKASSSLTYAIIGAIIIGDLWMVDKRYLNEDDFSRAKSVEKSIKPSAADQQIMADNSPYFRVFNAAVSSFNDNSTSYFHYSVGGYSAAKLFRYQDLIENHLSKGNMNVFNMLNAKYFITGQPGQEMAQQNPAALGNCWFVNEVSWATDADDEMAQLQDFNPASTVVIDERFKSYMDGFSLNPTSQGSITLSKFHPDNMEYSSESSTSKFVVFSEIWYKGNEDWKAYIDGKETEFIRVNYLLRGLKVPEGKHSITFKFYPKAHYSSTGISLASSSIIVLLVIGLIVIKLTGKTPSFIKED